MLQHAPLINCGDEVQIFQNMIINALDLVLVRLNSHTFMSGGVSLRLLWIQTISEIIRIIIPHLYIIYYSFLLNSVGLLDTF